jgi:hypothetical protein
MTSLIEKNLQFDLGSEWTAVTKWDKDAAFLQGIRKLAGTKAVDILASRKTDVLFVEIKDYRGSHALKKVLKNDELMRAVAKKVRDTIAGVVGAVYTRTNGPQCQLFVKNWATKTRVVVVLWLEDDLLSASSSGTKEELRTAEMGLLTDQLKSELRWLTSSVIVANSKSPLSGGLGIEVKNLPGAGKAS